MTRLDLIRRRAKALALRAAGTVPLTKAASMRRWRATRRPGFCSRCVTNPARPDRRTCQECIDAELRCRRARGHR